MSAKLRIGQGFDVHALVPGRRLVIGGVEIAHGQGLLGHSDADVLLHAIIDAILGAAGLGDIGTHFPDSDASYCGADSRALLRSACGKIQATGWGIENIDATVIAENPRIAPYAAAMKAVIAEACGIELDAINLKGKTTEKLGLTGRGEGIAAMAVALLTKA